MVDRTEVTATERARLEALRLAASVDTSALVSGNPDTASIVKRADAFFAFLSGKYEAPEA